MLSMHKTLGSALDIHLHMYIHKHSQKEMRYHVCLQAGSPKIMELGREFQGRKMDEESKVFYLNI